ncbi:antibiotic biosynthesis monooxygenase [bacterium]|nr:antibiotic biosynthesis monooxygenase [bacterium]MBR2273678.1 antibiotic biosynthesis monooxygenase [Alphaproteobacteria bacterium]
MLKIFYLVLCAVLEFVLINSVQAAEVGKAKIIVNIYYTGENGSARQFAEEMEQSGTVAAIRAEDGNLRYEYFYPKDDVETVLLIDIWESQEAIDRHHASLMMNKITELREKYNLHMKVERYIEDTAGIPGKDKAFIKE